VDNEYIWINSETSYVCQDVLFLTISVHTESNGLVKVHLLCIYRIIFCDGRNTVLRHKWKKIGKKDRDDIQWDIWCMTEDDEFRHRPTDVRECIQ
jgi:hypothetical protein